MSNLTHYVEVTCVGDDARETNALMAQAMHLSHAIFAGQQLKLSISFPGWVDPIKDSAGHCIKPGTFGHIVRAYGTEADCQSFLQQLRANRLVSRGVIGAEGPHKALAEPSVLFKRHRGHERTTHAYALREQRRLVRKANEGVILREPRTASERTALASHSLVNWLTLRSATNGHRFSLAVVRMPASACRTETVDGYGLGQPVPA